MSDLWAIDENGEEYAEITKNELEKTVRRMQALAAENERLRAVLRFAYEPRCDCEACYEIQKALAAVKGSDDDT